MRSWVDLSRTRVGHLKAHLPQLSLRVITGSTHLHPPGVQSSADSWCSTVHTRVISLKVLEGAKVGITTRAAGPRRRAAVCDAGALHVVPHLFVCLVHQCDPTLDTRPRVRNERQARMLEGCGRAPLPTIRLDLRRQATRGKCGI